MPTISDLPILRITSLFHYPVEGRGIGIPNPLPAAPYGHSPGFGLIPLGDEEEGPEIRRNIPLPPPFALLGVFREEITHDLWFWSYDATPGRSVLIRYPLKRMPFEAGDRVREQNCGSQIFVVEQNHGEDLSLRQEDGSGGLNSSIERVRLVMGWPIS